VLSDTKVRNANAQDTPFKPTDEKMPSAITNGSNLMGSQAASFCCADAEVSISVPTFTC